MNFSDDCSSPKPFYTFDVAKIPLSLYIHIPWCVKKCPYCDFNSHQLRGDEEFAHYVDTLLLDAKMQLPFVQGRVISTIFIGGGTPSLLPIMQYQRLFLGLKQILPLADDIEITMEANSGTLEHAPFSDYLAVGINRLSIGVQSFDENKLQVLGRIHSPEQALNAISQARQAGFQRVNVDLMYGLPKQTAKQAVSDIQIAHQAGATHLSWYQLTIEPNTVFYRNTPVLPDENNLEKLEIRGRECLLQLGYRNYEISAWVGQNDKKCRHNLNYWQFGDYLAIGAGAHGKVSLKNIDGFDDGIYRFSKSRLPKDYLLQPPYLQKLATFNIDTITNITPKFIGWQAIQKEDIASEFMMNVLRLHDGVPIAYFSERTGLAITEILPILQNLQQNKLLKIHNDYITTTELGRRYLNQVLQEFL